MAPEKPPEELYDLVSDPYEINNLASLPQHQATLKQMRGVLEKWQQETKDLGRVPELELRERMRPGGVWQKVEAPTMTVNQVESRRLVRLTCKTAGASLVYTTEAGAKPHWRLYTGELSFSQPVRLRAKASRLGWLESDEVSLPLPEK